MIKEFITKNVQETMGIARSLAEEICRPTIVLLDGDLGAGKTVFAKGFVSYFCPEADVLSPTFTIVNCYGDGVYHFDMYRIESVDELVNIGADEILFGEGNVSLVEWPNRAGMEYFGDDAIMVRIFKIDDNSRKIIIER